MARQVHVIVNPASGQPQPVLRILNDVFHAAAVDWDITITRKSRDAQHQAQAAAEAGVDAVAVYGGDGTVMEVARGLVGSRVPLAILPGGTANLMAVELGIPRDLAKATEIVCRSDSLPRQVDLGQIGRTYFFLRVGIGFDAHKVRLADRQLKDRFGILAYSIAALKALKESEPINFKITLDGEQVEVTGQTCMVDNAGNMGVSGFSIAKNISISDGLLDVIVVRDAKFRSLIAVGESIIDAAPDPELFQHWQAREIHIETESPHRIHVDGEMAHKTPVSIKVVPQAICVLTPAVQTESKST